MFPPGVIVPGQMQIGEGLAIEGYLRDNILIADSEVLSSGWGTIRGSVSSTAQAAPDPAKTSYKFTENSGTGGHGIYTNPSQAFDSGVTYTISVYAKAINRSWLRIGAESLVKDVYYNLATGALGTEASGCTGLIYPALNGFYRCSMSWTSDGTNSFNLYAETSDNGSGYAGSGVDALYLWGIQVEAFPTPGLYTET